MRRIAGELIPEWWAITSDGSPITDAAEGLTGAMLPFGAHKGSVISSMIELMAGAMLGEFMSKEALDFAEGGPLPRHGALIIAFDPARLGPQQWALSGGRGRSADQRNDRPRRATALRTTLRCTRNSSYTRRIAK